ncbi:MAG: sulfatase family protein [Pirellulaceae bacterium]
MHIRCWLAAIQIALLLVVLTANPVASSDHNIVLFVTDDESPTLGCYGDPMAITPHADALASDGVLFRNAWATTASCSPSRSVILSGTYSHLNGMHGLQHNFHHFESFAAVGALSLPNVLGNHGYRTAQIGKYHVAPESAYHFETYLRANPRSTVEMAEACRGFLTDPDDERPFFLYFATSDPHRGGGKNQSSNLELKPDMFGNKPNRESWPDVDEHFYDPAVVPVPPFLSDSRETREELAEYYQSCSRIDQGLGRLVQILKEHDLYDKTLIIFTSDHGMAFAGAKTTVYEAGLRVPLIVRNPYAPDRGRETEELVSHVDLTPTILEFAGALDPDTNAPRNLADTTSIRRSAQAGQPNRPRDNSGRKQNFSSYQGRSWLPVLLDPGSGHSEFVFASHTFHEVQMYYPMRAIRDQRYKLIWNIASPLEFPFAADLWAASSWQAQFAQGPEADYGYRTVRSYLNRPEFELYDLQDDSHETSNLAADPAHQSLLESMKARLRGMQDDLRDPWIRKWDHE